MLRIDWLLERTIWQWRLPRLKNRTKSFKLMIQFPFSTNINYLMLQRMRRIPKLPGDCSLLVVNVRFCWKQLHRYIIFLCETDNERGFVHLHTTVVYLMEFKIP